MRRYHITDPSYLVSWSLLWAHVLFVQPPEYGTIGRLDYDDKKWDIWSLAMYVHHAKIKPLVSPKIFRVIKVFSQYLMLCDPFAYDGVALVFPGYCIICGLGGGLCMELVQHHRDPNSISEVNRQA